MSCRTIWIVAAVVSLSVLSSASISAHEGETKASLGDPYPFDKCVVSGGKLDSMGKPFVHVHMGREVKFCCEGCLPKFKKEPKKYLDKLDAQIIKAQLPRYPLKTCVVSGKALDTKDMKPVNLVYKNRLVRLCCAHCEGGFRKDVAKHLKKIDQAVIAAHKKHYPLTKCVVSGKDLGSMGKPVDLVVANRLIRLCCAGCKGKARAESGKYLRQLDKSKK